MNDIVCDWPTWVRWLVFLPLGIVCSGLAHGILTGFDNEALFINELIALAAEPWAFLLPALWVIPRYRRALIVVSTLVFACIASITIYLTFTMPNFSVQPWVDISSSVAWLVSAGFCAAFTWQKYEKNS